MLPSLGEKHPYPVFKSGVLFLVVLIIVLLFKPAGLLGKEIREKV